MDSIISPSEDILNRFSYHPPRDSERAGQHERARALFLKLAATMDRELPPGREKELEEALFWANAAIARQP